MKLLFVGLGPEPALTKMLLANQFAVVQIKEGEPLPPDEPDLVAFRPSPKGSLDFTQKLRTHYPTAWIAIVTKRAQLKSTDFHNELLKTVSKNDVWVEEDWQLMFWLSIQRLLQHQSVLKDMKGLRASYDDLSSSSHRLIQQLEKDVGLAATIQRSLLPRVPLQIPGISVAVKYLAAEGKGGDYYDIFEFGDKKRFGVLVADSKTHGMAAALLSALLKVRVEEMKERFPDTKSFMAFLNREIQQGYKAELSSVSLLYGILDRAALTFQYSSAGSLRPVLWREGAPLPLSAKHDPPLGEMTLFEFHDETVQLKPKDLLILHTDGLEAPLRQRHEHAFDGLVELLRKRAKSPQPQEVQNELMALVDEYIEKQPLSDDLTVIHFAIDERALYVAQTQSR